MTCSRRPGPTCRSPNGANTHGVLHPVHEERLVARRSPTYDGSARRVPRSRRCGSGSHKNAASATSRPPASADGRGADSRVGAAPGQRRPACAPRFARSSGVVRDGPAQRQARVRVLGRARRWRRSGRYAACVFSFGISNWRWGYCARFRHEGTEVHFLETERVSGPVRRGGQRYLPSGPAGAPTSAGDPSSLPKGHLFAVPSGGPP